MGVDTSAGVLVVDNHLPAARQRLSQVDKMLVVCELRTQAKFSLTKETAAVFSMHSDLPTITSKCGLGVSNNWTGI